MLKHGLATSDSLRPHGLYNPWNSPGKNTGVGTLSLLQGIFPNQGSNPGLLYCRHILYQPSHQGCPPRSSSVQFSSATQSSPTLCDPMDCSMPGFSVHYLLLELTQTQVHRVGVDISSSVVPFSSCFQSFLAIGFFPRSQFFESGTQTIGFSASASVFPMNIQDRFPLGWTGWISLLSKGLSRIFSNTTVQKHQFFGAQLSL